MYCVCINTCVPVTVCPVSVLTTFVYPVTLCAVFVLTTFACLSRCVLYLYQQRVFLHVVRCSCIKNVCACHVVAVAVSTTCVPVTVYVVPVTVYVVPVTV